MKAQILACQGEIDRAIDLYDRAMECSEPGSEFHVYLLVLKGTACSRPIGAATRPS